MSLIVKNLTKIYGSQKAVDNISFETGKGSILGFLGPNGAGKSTTMKIATCSIPMTSGLVTVCGLDVNTNSLEIRKKIGYLAENNPLYYDMYVSEYLGFIGGLYGLKGNNLKLKIDQMIDLTGLKLEYKKKIGSLSKGYKQRVGLAQAIIHDPEVLILDEPTTGLDPNQMVEIRALIKSLSKDKTVIFSTHIMQEVQALCDKVIIIDKGKIKAYDTVQTLSDNQKPVNKVFAQFTTSIDIEMIKTIQGVVNVDQEENLKYIIVAEQNIDIRPALFQMASAQNWPIVEMRLEENSMEKVFQSFTR